MKQISYWASTHIAMARLLIVVIKIVMAALAYYTGILLTGMQVKLPAALLNGFALLLMLAVVVCYPKNQKTAGYKKLQYARRKLCDFLLPLCAVMVIIASVNHADIVNISTVAYASTIVKGKTAQEILQSGKSRESLTGKEKRVLKREFFKQLKVYAAAVIKGDEAGSDNAFKVILAIIALLGLLYLLMALVCNLSCGGSDVAAVLVGVLGLAGLIWGFVAVLNAIKRKSAIAGNVPTD